MADITLAEWDGAVWLVGGEDYIDDLLIDRLAPEVTIEFVACARKSEVHDLWKQNCGEPTYIGDPWMIHPGIVRRIRRKTPDHAVFFAQWSVALDGDAMVVIRNAANLATTAPDAPVQLTEYLDPAAAPAMAGLSALRAQLIEDELARAGVARERFVRVRRDVADLPGAGEESQRVDIAVKVDT